MFSVYEFRYEQFKYEPENLKLSLNINKYSRKYSENFQNIMEIYLPNWFLFPGNFPVW